MTAAARKPSVLLALGWSHPKIHRGVARHAREHGWHLDTSAWYSASVPDSWQGDGVVTQQYLISGFCPAASLIARQQIPAVKIGFHVSNDDEAIGRLGADFFTRRGFRDFAWAGWRDCPTPREQAFRETLAARGHECRDLLIPRDVEAWTARQLLWIELLRGLPRPTAVLAITDDIAVDIVAAAEAAGLRVPHDVAVLGVRNDELVCESLPVGVSSIDNNLEGVGYRAADLLIRHLDRGEPLPAAPVLVPPTGVVERGSTDLLAVANRDVERALRFIRQNFRKPIDLDAVVAAAGASQRSLYKAFRQVLGCTIHEHLVRERLDCAKRLLCETDAAIESVAVDAGFGDARTMFTHFKRDTGTGPAEWRKLHRPAKAASPTGRERG